MRRAYRIVAGRSPGAIQDPVALPTLWQASDTTYEPILRRRLDRAHGQTGRDGPRWTARCVSSLPMDIVQKMKRDWNRRASHHAKFWIATEDWQTDDAFADSGRETGERIRRLIGANWQPGWRALEIGCGIGRVMRALAPYVAEIHGVDVSADMIRQSHEWLSGVAHAHTHENSGVDLALFDAAYFDFVYAYVAFQHMPRPVFAAYLRDARRVLRPGGFIAFQIYLAGAGFVEPEFDDTLSVRLYAREALDRALATSGFTSLDEVCEHRTPQGLESWLVLAAADREPAVSLSDDWRLIECDTGVSPMDEALYAGFARRSIESGDARSALGALDELVRCQPANIQARLELAELTVAQGDIGRGRDVLRAGTELAPDRLEPWLQWMMMEVHAGQLANGADVGLAMLRQHPGYANGYKSVVTLLCAIGRRHDAAALVDRLRSLESDSQIIADVERVLEPAA